MRAALDDAAVVEDDDVVGVFHRGDAVRDDQRRPSPSAPRAAHRRIRSSVAVSTALSESSRIRMAGSRTSARAMAVRCFCPPESVMPRSPITRLQSLRERGDVAGESGQSRRVVAPRRRVASRAAEADVLRDRLGEEERLLRHHADPVAQLRAAGSTRSAGRR